MNTYIDMVSIRHNSNIHEGFDIVLLLPPGEKLR